MSSLADYKVAIALQQTNRVMSMLSLIEAAITQEMNFQDEHVTRPIVVGDAHPGLGEIIDTVVICRETLSECWQTLKREGL